MLNLSINMYCALIQNAQDGYMTVHNLSQFSIFLIYNFQFFQWGDGTHTLQFPQNLASFLLSFTQAFCAHTGISTPTQSLAYSPAWV